MAEQVTIRLEPPLSFIQAQSGAFRRELLDLRPLWERFGKTMAAIEQERFDSRGYGEWPALAASTLAQKAAHGFPLDPLIRTRAMIDELTDPGAGSKDVGPQTFAFGSSQPYAEFHQDGTDRMPQRKVIEIRTEDRRRLESEQVSWLNEVARRTWGRV